MFRSDVAPDAFLAVSSVSVRRSVTWCEVVNHVSASRVHEAMFAAAFGRRPPSQRDRVRSRESLVGVTSAFSHVAIHPSFAPRHIVCVPSFVFFVFVIAVLVFRSSQRGR